MAVSNGSEGRVGPGARTRRFLFGGDAFGPTARRRARMGFMSGIGAVLSVGLVSGLLSDEAGIIPEAADLCLRLAALCVFSFAGGHAGALGLEAAAAAGSFGEHAVERLLGGLRLCAGGAAALCVLAAALPAGPSEERPVRLAKAPRPHPAEAAIAQGRLLPPIAGAPHDVRREAVCLALNIYHEARGESAANRWAVGLATLNRMADARFPKTVCGVIDQPSQFSWRKSVKDPLPKETKAWSSAQAMAWTLLNTPPEGVFDPVKGRRFFVEASIVDRVPWMRDAGRKTAIGSHVFADAGKAKPRAMRPNVLERRLCPFDDCQ